MLAVFGDVFRTKSGGVVDADDSTATIHHGPQLRQNDVGAGKTIWRKRVADKNDRISRGETRFVFRPFVNDVGLHIFDLSVVEAMLQQTSTGRYFVAAGRVVARPDNDQNVCCFRFVSNPQRCGTAENQ